MKYVYQVLNSNNGVVYESTHYGKALHQSRMLGYELHVKEISFLKWLSYKAFLQ